MNPLKCLKPMGMMVSFHIGQRHALKEAARAHQDLETRRTKGATVSAV